eukprot:s917_g35.t1
MRLNDALDRMDRLRNQVEQNYAEHGDAIQTASSEVSMTHDYVTGLHYAVVEHGGFLRNGLGLTHDQWVYLTTLERGNLVSSRTMGTVECMRLVRQRFTPQGAAETTDVRTLQSEDEQGEENDESETEEDDAVMEPSTPARVQSLTDMVEFLQAEHLGCLERREY